MPPEPQRPLFAQVGRNSGTPTDPKSRGYLLLVAVGLLVATGALLSDLTERGRWVTVRVTLDGPALTPEEPAPPVEAPPAEAPPAEAPPVDEAPAPTAAE